MLAKDTNPQLPFSGRSYEISRCFNMLAHGFKFEEWYNATTATTEHGMMKNPTFAKLKRKGLTPIRYRGRRQAECGWIVERRARGALTIQLAGRNTVTRLSAAEAEYVVEL